MLSFDERLKNLTETIGPEEEVKRMQELIRKHEWKFATTYAAFCPHEYTLKERGWNWEDWSFFIRFIWEYGMYAAYGKQSQKPYWFDHDNGYYYFLMDGDIDENGNVSQWTTLINRSKIEYFDFWLEEDLIGKMVRCKVRKGAPRLAQIEHGMITEEGEPINEGR